MDVVTLTMNPTIDFSAQVDVVVADRKLHCDGERREAGGGGVNVARVTTRLGAKTTALFPAGGHAGHMLVELLAAEGVATQAIAIAGDTRENVFIRETTTSRHYRFGMPGPTLSPVEVQRCFDAALAHASPTTILVVSGSLPPGVPADFPAKITAAAEAKGATVVLDTSGEALQHAVKAGASLVKPNQRELEVLVGGGDVEQAARALVDAGGVDALLVSMGRGGALLVTKEGVQEIHAPPVTLVSKIGAGDSTVAGTVAKLAAGWPLAEAARYGVASGSAAVLSHGTGLCRPEDVERLYQAMQARRAA